jgi:hypothetical protein
MMERSGLVSLPGYVSEEERRGLMTGVVLRWWRCRMRMRMTKRPSYSEKQVSANWYPVRFSFPLFYSPLDADLDFVG